MAGGSVRVGRRIRLPWGAIAGAAMLIALAFILDDPAPDTPAPDTPARTERRSEPAAERAPDRYAPSVRADWATALGAVPGVGHAEWRGNTLYVFVDFRGSEEEFEMLALRLCRELARTGVGGVYLHLLDHELAGLGERKTRAHRLCR